MTNVVDSNGNKLRLVFAPCFPKERESRPLQPDPGDFNRLFPYPRVIFSWDKRTSTKRGPHSLWPLGHEPRPLCYYSPASLKARTRRMHRSETGKAPRASEVWGGARADAAVVPPLKGKVLGQISIIINDTMAPVPLGPSTAHYSVRRAPFPLPVYQGDNCGSRRWLTSHRHPGVQSSISLCIQKKKNWLSGNFWKLEAWQLGKLMWRGINKTVHTLETVLTHQGAWRRRRAQATSASTAPPRPAAARQPQEAGRWETPPTPRRPSLGPCLWRQISASRGRRDFRVGEPILDAPEMPTEEKIKVTCRLKIQPDLVFRRLGSKIPLIAKFSG